MKTISLLFIVLSYIIAPSLTIANPNSNKKVEIIIPGNGSNFKCIKTNEGRYLDLIIKGSSLNLEPGEYITIVLKPKNCNEWIRIGKSLKISNNHSSNWAIKSKTLVDKKCKESLLKAIVTKSPINNDIIEENEMQNEIDILCSSSDDYIISPI